MVGDDDAVFIIKRTMILGLMLVHPRTITQFCSSFICGQSEEWLSRKGKLI